MGRSRGGLTTKIHAVMDAFGRPVGLSLTEGQAYDGHAAKAWLKALPVDAIVLADRAYDADSIRKLISQRGAWANISAMPQRRKKPVFIQAPLQAAQSGREVLQQTQTLVCNRNKIRKRPRELSGRYQTRFNKNMDQI